VLHGHAHARRPRGQALELDVDRSVAGLCHEVPAVRRGLVGLDLDVHALERDSVARRMSSDDIVNVRYATESSVYDVPVPPATPAPAPNTDNPTAAHP